MQGDLGHLSLQAHQRDMKPSSPGHAGQAPAPSPAGSPKYPLMQPALPYSFSAQEPLIDNTTQMLHWTKHLATYYENVNKAIMPFPALQVCSPWSAALLMGLVIGAYIAVSVLHYPCCWPSINQAVSTLGKSD